MQLTGVVRGGRRQYDNPAAAVLALKDLEGKRFTETLEKERTRRSTAQNRRYFVLVKLGIECMRQTKNVQMSKDQVHTMFVLAFIGHIDTPFGPVRKESKTLSTEEFSHFMDQCELWLRETWLGFDVELPE